MVGGDSTDFTVALAGISRRVFYPLRPDTEYIVTVGNHGDREWAGQEEWACFFYVYILSHAIHIQKSSSHIPRSSLSPSVLPLPLSL